MTTIPIDGKEYEVKKGYRIEGKEALVLFEVPKKPAPLQEWATVHVCNGSIDSTRKTKPELERLLKEYHTPKDFRIARIVEVPENARRVWAVMDKYGHPEGGLCDTRAIADLHLEFCASNYDSGPYTLHELIEVGEVKA